MNKLLKWIIVLAALVVAFCCASAFAETSGTCGKNGDNLTWTLDDQGKLTISGTGEMKDYSQSNYAPWRGEGVKNAVLEDGVTSIGSRAFSECVNLASVTIPDSVTSIGAQAFYECSSLTSVTIPKGVTRLESEIFCNCANLASVTLPKGLTVIGNYAFSACSKLMDVYYSGTEAEKGSLTIGSDNACLTNAQWHYAPAIVDSGRCGKYGDKVTWTLDDEGTLTISGTGEMADYYPNAPWHGDRVKSAIIEEGVTSIGQSAFSSCRRLTSVNIQNGVTGIDAWAFDGCSSLTSVNIPDGVTIIGSFAFQNCSSLTSATIPESVTSIGSYAFNFCNSLMNLNIPEGMTSIGSYAFNCCGSLTSVNIPEGVTSINDAAFRCCSSLTSVNIQEGVTSIGSEAFYHCSSLTDVSIPDTVTSIGTFAFENCSRLTSMSIPKGVTSIGYDAFRDCSSLTSICIPDSVTSIDSYVFYGCSNLTSVNIPDSVTTIDDSAFWRCSSLLSVCIPDGVTSIGDSAFYGCEKLSKILVPTSVNKIGGSAIPGGATIYCYEFTCAENWAKQNGNTIVYLDGGVTDDMRSLTLPDELPRQACGDSVQLTANVFPAIDVGEITWTSSNSAVASVESGLVTALIPGKTTITATMGTLSDSVEVTTYIRATGFAIPEEVWFVAKNSVTLPVTDIQPEGAELVLTWSSDNTSVQVNNTGVVTCNIADKDATITATTDNGISHSCLVHVYFPVTTVAFSDTQLSLKEGDAAQLTANVTAKTRNIVNKLVTFASNDESVATVDKDGKVTAVGIGTATITATAANGVSGSIEISVACAEHTVVTDEAVAPTCTETGLTEGSHCSVCGTVLVAQTVIPANGHTEIETGAVSPTCEGIGYTAGKYCTVCEQYLEGHEEIAALNHDWQTDYSEWFQDGDDWKITATRTCQRQNCDSGENGGPAMETETATATSAVTTPATCVADGVRTWTATFANEAFETKTRTDVIPLDADAHDWNEVTYTWSDDNTSVTAAVTCKNSGDHTLTETANTTSNQTKAPTYFAKGETTYTATFTNALFTEQTRVVDDIAIKEKDAEVKAVEAMIAALKDGSTLSDKDNVNAAREAYQNLTDEQKQQQVSTDILAKLETAEQQVQAAKAAAAKQAVDEKAAKTVADAIGSLGSSAGLGDKAAVEAARKAYDNLTDDQKKLVPTEVSDKLTAAEASVKAAEEAEAARKAKEEAERKAKEEAERKAKEEAERKAKEEAARKAAEEEAARKAAEEEAARKAAEEEAARKAAEEEAARKAAEEEAARKAAEEEAAKQAADEAAAKSAADAIQALSDSVGLGDKEAVAAARAAYDALTEDQKKLIPGEVLSKLATAEQQIAAAEEAARTVDISACKITVKDLAYTGKKVKKPSVTIRYGETQLTEGTDYSFTYNTKAKAIGAYKLTVTGMGRYTGSVNTTFKVVPKGTAFSKLTGGDKLITLKWKSQKNITGYQIEYSLKKDFSSSKKVTVKKAKTLTTTIKKLKAGKAYYVRIRTYTTVKKKNYFSAWSKAKAVKTKASKAKNNFTVPNIEVTMNVGEKLELSPLIAPDASDNVLTWATSDDTIATVTQDGVATALTPGEVVITATNDEGEQATAVVRVNEAEGVVLLDLGDNDLLLNVDDEFGEEIITVDGDTPVEIEEPAA